MAAAFAALPGVRAEALAGSSATGVLDARSDIDLSVYCADVIAPEVRQAIAARFSAQAEIDNRFWEPGDEWRDAATGIGVDVMYRSPEWIAGELDRVLVRHEAAIGHTTCLWHTVQRSRPLFDRDGWYAALQARADVPYPETLRRAIVARNHPILRATQSSYARQIASAVARHDVVSQCHRVAALLASYFDILFAVNRQPHPGEKRQIVFAQQLCPMLPESMTTDVERVVWALGAMDDRSLLVAVQALLHRLDRVLLDEGLITLPRALG